MGRDTPPKWYASIVVAAVIATSGGLFATAGSLWVSWYNAQLQRELEVRRSEQALILAMMNTGDPDKAARNLEFLVSTGLVADPALVTRLRHFLEARVPGGGPYLSGEQATRYWSDRLREDAQRLIAEGDAWMKAHPDESPTPTPSPVAPKP
jgi:hypothetical protein